MAETPVRKEITIPRMGPPRGGGPGRFRPSEKPKNPKGTLRRIIGIYLRWGKTLFVVVLLTAISAALTVAIPLFVGKVFNTFDITLNTVDMRLLTTFVLIVASLYISNWVITTLTGVMMLRVSQKLVKVLRSEFFEKMQKLPLMFYDTVPHGDTMSRLANDVDNISQGIAQSTTQLVSGVLTIVGSLVTMLALNIPLTLAVLICVPLVAGITRVITKRSHKHFLSQQTNLGILNGIIEENIMGLKMVKAFARQETVLEEFAGVNQRLCESGRLAHSWAGFMMPLMNVVNNLTFAFVAVVGGVMAVKYGVLIGTVVSFLNYSKQFAQPLNTVAGIFNTLQQSLAGAERVFEILDEAEEAADLPDAVEMKNPRGDVTFENVTFSYDKERDVLKDVSFEVEAGEIIALVGETGAGKTTVVNLLTRFYDADKGRILIDGTDIRAIKRDSLRECFSVVLQDTSLFTGTIMDNIRYSKMDATDEEVVQAAKLSHADKFIEKLPQGYDTMLSAGSDSLSEGQRQLLAIARAVLCQCPILILDEATSSVDTKTEKDIQRALVRLMENRTSFLIAHRLSTIREADRIMVIGDGRMLECGSHDELMDKRGRYYEMVASQMGIAGYEYGGADE